MTGNDRALSGIIAALLARGCCGDRVRGTDRFPELRQPCNAAELHLEEEKSAGTPPARCEMAAELERVEYPLDQNGLCQLVIEGTTQREPSQHRTVMTADPQSFTIILQSQQAGRATIACGWASRNPSMQRARQYGITISVISGRF
jgi:hypothetical protein